MIWIIACTIWICAVCIHKAKNLDTQDTLYYFIPAIIATIFSIFQEIGVI